MMTTFNITIFRLTNLTSIKNFLAFLNIKKNMVEIDYRPATAPRRDANISSPTSASLKQTIRFLKARPF